MNKIFKYGLSAIILGYLYFNRNPYRSIPEGDNFVSPADGIIQSIQFNRIEIFIDITDIHYQRSPFEGQIINIIEDSPSYNVIEINTPLGYTVIERWGGELARTVITYVKKDQYVKKGDIIGRIILGSHASITIPPDLNILVRPNQHVLAGETIIAI